MHRGGLKTVSDCVAFHVLVIKTSVTKPVEELNQSTPTYLF